MLTATALLALALLGSGHPRAPESPALALYRQLGLPLPPKDAELGFAAVPALLAHLDDDRATLVFRGRMRNSAPHFGTVGNFCSEIVAHLMSGWYLNRRLVYGDPKPAEWWAEVQSKDERTSLESVVFLEEGATSTVAEHRATALRMLRDLRDRALGVAHRDTTLMRDKLRQ